MKRIPVAIAFFLTLGINSKSGAQARFAAASNSEASSHASAATSNNEVHAYAPAASNNAVKEIPASPAHSSTPAMSAEMPASASNMRAMASSGVTPLSAGTGNYHEPGVISGGITRYSPVTKQAHAYYSTPVTKYKARKHNNHFRKDRYDTWQLFFGEPYFGLFFDCEVAYEDVMMSNDERTIKGASVLNVSLDGYVVYHGDTLSGIVTVTDKAIYLEQPLDSKRETGYTFGYDDNGLKTVAVFEGNNSLYLGRPGGTGKISRIIHCGKLSIYDDHYNFLTPANVHRAKMTAEYNGQVKAQKSFLESESKQQLVESINSAYGLQLDAKDFTWSQLLSYLDSLD